MSTTVGYFLSVYIPRTKTSLNKFLGTEVKIQETMKRMRIYSVNNKERLEIIK